MIRMTKTRLADKVFLVRFNSQYAVASTFLRIQEHHESPTFRNKVFTLEQYMDWYAERFGAFTYYQDWSGFNVPSTAFQPFYDGAFDPLLRKEARLLRLFRRERGPFYVIGISDDADLKHEIAHALYFTRPEYREDVRRATAPYDTTSLHKRLARGYHRAVWEDEVHAYLATPGSWLGPIPRRLQPLRRELRAILLRHAGALGLA
jgi:hypothetical protein